MTPEKTPGAPRVSVIIIFLDEARFLGDAIASVVAQTCDRWELILVDDGSRDGSAEIAQQAVHRDPARIRYLQHPHGANRGMSASRNVGIAAARGDLIAFLDGDDCWVPEKLAEQVAVLDAHPDVAICYGRTLIWHTWAPEPAEPDYCYPLGVSPNRVHAPPALLLVMLRNRAQTPTTANAIMRRSVVRAVGAFEAEFRGMFEDQVFFTKMLLVASCWVDDRVWARYRQHGVSHSAQSEGAGSVYAARMTFLRWADAYVRTNRPRRARDYARVRLALVAARADARWQAARHALRARTVATRA